MPDFPYSPLPGSRDELADGGDHRPHWRPFWDGVRRMGLRELTRRWDEAKQVIRENGVTYNVYGDPHGMDRPWQLDPVPLLIDEPDARFLEAGLTQRARLLDALLADLYGPQRSLRDGLFPPELVFGHAGFLRPCHGVKVPFDRYLHLYAADVGRGADGAFRVLGDRTQAPSGAGYALENRIVMSRMLPEVFDACRVQRLALFFRTLRDTIRSLAPRNRDNPRIVLLTPGPYNETYFEHAYLARYLGYTLAEGGDLTVRDGRVYLKLLGGLQPVDVILRRLDDDFCDPLELRGDSFLGVPGLVEAVRAGNVAVANALGSGLTESPAVLPYLPRLCRYLLGEDLKIPSVETWWCGDAAARGHVLANIGGMVIKPTAAAHRFAPIFGSRLSATERSDLAARITAAPARFVAQEQLALSTVPVLNGEHLEPRHVVLRTYLAACGDTFVGMPGGLTRVTATADTLVVSMQLGGGSKDTWVLSSEPVNPFTLLGHATRPVELSRGGSDLPSRAADNLFWLGRYAERADGLVRMLRGVLVRLTEKSGVADVPELTALVRVLGAKPGADPEKLARRVLFDATSADSLTSTLKVLQRIARLVRDRISNDMWRVLTHLRFPEPSHDGYGLPGPGTWSDLLDELDRLVGSLAAFGGLTADSMTRGQGWRFLDMGRRMERALHMIRLVRGTLVSVAANEAPVLEAVLEIADSSITYRRRYLSSVQVTPALDLLLADEMNPRSLAFQLADLTSHVDQLPRPDTQPGRTPEQRDVLRAVTSLRLADVGALGAVEDGRRPQLEALLGQVSADLASASDAITQTFLSHLQTARHLAERA